MKKQVFVMQDSVSGNCGEPIFAENLSTLKRSFAAALASGDIPAWVARDTHVLDLGWFVVDENNQPHLVVDNAPLIVCRLSDSDIQELAQSIKAAAAKRFAADLTAQNDPDLAADTEQLPTPEELENSF